MELQDQFDTARQSILQALSKQRDDVLDHVASKTTQLAESQKEVARLQEQVDDLRKQLKIAMTYRKKCQAYEEHRDKLEHENTTLKEKVWSFVEVVLRLEKPSEATHDDLEVTTDALQKAGHQFEDVEKSLSSLQERADQLEAENKKLHSHREILKSEYRIERRQRKQLQQQLDSRRLSCPGEVTKSKPKGGVENFKQQSTTGTISTRELADAQNSPCTKLANLNQMELQKPDGEQQVEILEHPDPSPKRSHDKENKQPRERQPLTAPLAITPGQLSTNNVAQHPREASSRAEADPIGLERDNAHVLPQDVVQLAEPCERIDGEDTHATGRWNDARAGLSDGAAAVHDHIAHQQQLEENEREGDDRVLWQTCDHLPDSPEGCQAEWKTKLADDAFVSPNRRQERGHKRKSPDTESPVDSRRRFNQRQKEAAPSRPLANIRGQPRGKWRCMKVMDEIDTDFAATRAANAARIAQRTPQKLPRSTHIPAALSPNAPTPTLSEQDAFVRDNRFQNPAPADTGNGLLAEGQREALASTARRRIALNEDNQSDKLIGVKETLVILDAHQGLSHDRQGMSTKPIRERLPKIVEKLPSKTDLPPQPGIVSPAPTTRPTSPVNPPGQPGYKYREVVRRKADRENLTGYECPDCAGFFRAVESWGMGNPALKFPLCGHAKDKKLQGNAIDQMRQEGSRHRFRHKPPSTPPGFWNLGFGDSQDSPVK